MNFRSRGIVTRTLSLSLLCIVPIVDCMSDFYECTHDGKQFILLPFLLAGLLSCSHDNRGIVLIDADNFKTTESGKPVDLYTLESKNGLVMQVTNFGAHVVSLWVPDRDGRYDDVVLGHKSLDEYIDYRGERFISCVVGRYANRIANGQFTLDGITYNVPKTTTGRVCTVGSKGWTRWCGMSIR